MASIQDDSNALFDVIIAGAGLAGCTAARLYALRGLRVALVELQPDSAAFKPLCTHYIQPSALPTLRKLGLDSVIEEAGGLRNSVDMWTRYGWTGEQTLMDEMGNPIYGYNIRRVRLDPLLRELAAQTPGVTLLSGCSVRGVIQEQGAVVGFEIGGRQSCSLRAPLAVAADGRNSRCAQLADICTQSAPNCRFGILRAYRDVPLRRGHCSQMWFHGEDVGYVFPNEDGVTVVAYMPHKDRLAEFRADAAVALEASMAQLPDAPDLKRAQPLAAPLFVKDYPSLWRPAVAQGMALIGDAHLSLDPLWGVGCGFALQSADWLVESTAADLLARKPVAAGLKRYACEITRRLRGHRFLLVDFARRRRFNALERLMFSAAARDERMARHLMSFGARLTSPMQFLAPRALLRAIWVNLRHQIHPASAAGANASAT